MTTALTGKSFLKILDFAPEELRELLKLAHKVKADKKADVDQRILDGKNIVLLFEKTSTRTRCAFEVAAHDLGMNVTYVAPGTSQMGEKESVSDTAKVLGRFFDGIEYRGFSQETVETLAKESGVPVWNGLTDTSHPTQMIADIMTIQENFGEDVAGRKLVFMGDSRNNVANSLMVICSKLGMHFVACGPKRLQPEGELVKTCEEICLDTGGSVALEENVEVACKDADVIYTDIWVSMGEAKEIWGERIELLKPYQVTSNVMSLANGDCIFMHCLPSFHDLNTGIGKQVFEEFGVKEMEVTDEIFNSEKSVVFDQAENRMHSIKAIMLATLS